MSTPRLATHSFAASKANAVHGHPQTDITGLVTALSLLAPLSGAVLANPEGNTPTGGDNSTRLATTAFVNAAITAAVIAARPARATAEAWTVANAVLPSGVIGVESDTLRFKIGDGVTVWVALVYSGEFFDGVFSEGVAPATPASGKVILYAKTDGLLYSKDDAGVETLVSGAAAGFDGTFTEAAAPATPAAGKVVIYAKTDGLVYSKDDAGVETLVSGGTGFDGNFTEAAEPATPASGKVVIYAKADGLLYSKDDAGVETLVSGGSPSVAPIPQNSKSAAYTLVIGDAGKHILHPAADTSARTFTIPSNASVAFPIGTTITFVNEWGAGVVTLAITSDTLQWAGSGTTGSRTLAAGTMATILKITSTKWIITGTGGIT